MKTVLLICGGQSAEHEISLLSAQSILKAINRNTYRPLVVIVSRAGNWCYCPNPDNLNEVTHCETVLANGTLCSLMRRPEGCILITETGFNMPIDVAFPLIHGPMGEDGTLQGFLEMMALPYVGSEVIATALCMDKDFSKQLFQAHGLPIVPFITLKKQAVKPTFQAACEKLAAKALFVKPAKMGSSVGIAKAKNAVEFTMAIEDAFLYDEKIIIERAIQGRELECAILGNDALSVTGIGEIKPTHEFYSYEAKYLDENGAELIIPAHLPPETIHEMQQLALRAFQLAECRGFARIDCFLTDNGTLYLNEINTIPGFTKISMYPKLWQAEGLSYPALIDALLELACERHQQKQALQRIPNISTTKTSKVS